MKIFITLNSQAPCSRDCPVQGGCKLPPARAGGCSRQGQAGEVMEVAVSARSVPSWRGAAAEFCRISVIGVAQRGGLQQVVCAGQDVQEATAGNAPVLCQQPGKSRK